MRSLLLATVLALFALLVSSFPTTDNNPTPDHDMIDLLSHLRGSKTFDGLDDQVSSRPASSSFDRSDSTPSLDRRANAAVVDELLKKKILCRARGAMASLEKTKQHIESLRQRAAGRGAQPMRPGAKCQRAECLGNSAIIWCNFDTKHKTLPSWNNVADGAQTIVDHCKEAGKVSGIHWHDDLWAVIVQEQECYPNNPN